MGTAAEYRCAHCGYQFSATEDWSFGFSGAVVTPIVCSEHGLAQADTGINVAAGGRIGPETTGKTRYPCPKCGADSPRWDRESCPKCGGERLVLSAEIIWD
ncbi:MAG: hypothetical protein K0U80_14300 [Actinomycetia bacterium]|nr:hypothetical protein [Actinomycetes bacterium]